MVPLPARRPTPRAAPLTLAAALLLTALAGCLAPAGTLAPQEAPPGADGAARWAPQQWREALSEPVYDAVETTVHRVEMPDGAELSLTLHLPAGLAAGETVPTLLQITPYQSFATYGDATGLYGAYGAWEFYVRRGAAYVEADARGTTGSEGCLDFGGSKDRADAAALAEWVRGQPWSNGVIVTDGVSHPGMGSVVAHTSVPGLAGALAHAPVVSYYQDEWLQGAKFEDQFNGAGYQAFELLPTGHVGPDALKAQAATCTGETLLDYSVVDGPFTEKWADRDLSRHAPAEEKPVLLTHGFVDVNVHPDHAQLYWDALPDDYPKYAVFGWWYHGWPDMAGHPAESFEDVRHRWLDATLFGRDNGLWSEPRVLVEDDRGVWHEGHDWPLEPSELVTLHPTAEGALAPEAGVAGGVSYVDRLGAERGRWEGASAVFRSEPLEAPRLVNGAPRLELVASSTAPATKWVAYLLEEAPDGSWQRVTHGYADSHTWAGEGAWEPMAPGEAYNWTLSLMPTAVVVEAGHRLVLVVASQDSRRDPHGGLVGGEEPCFSDHRGGCYEPSGIVPADSAGRAENTVRVGPGGTRLTLAWVHPDATAKPPAGDG